MNNKETVVENEVEVSVVSTTPVVEVPETEESKLVAHLRKANADLYSQLKQTQNSLAVSDKLLRIGRVEAQRAIEESNNQLYAVRRNSDERVRVAICEANEAAQEVTGRLTVISTAARVTATAVADLHNVLSATESAGYSDEVNAAAKKLISLL